MNLGADRSGHARTDGFAVERRDGQHLPRGRGHPDLVRRAQLALRHGANLVRDGAVAQDLEHHVVGDSGQYEVRLRGAEDGSVPHDEDVARRGLGQLALAHQDRLDAALVRGEGAQHAIAEQRSRLDVAAQPAEIGHDDRLGAGAHQLRRRRDELARHEKDGRFEALGKSVVALGRAARDLEVDVLVLPGIARDDLFDELGPLRVRVRVGNAYRVEACPQPVEVLGEAEGAPGIRRDYLVDAVSENEAAVEHGNLRLFDRHELAVEIDHLRYLNHSVTLSHALWKMPAAATLSSATRGYSLTSLPSCDKRRVATRCPAASGATSGCWLTSSAFNLSAVPLGTVTYRSAAGPAFNSRSLPFQTASLPISWFFS